MNIIQILQLLAVVGCIFISGLSFCLSFWVIPVLEASDVDRITTKQFDIVIKKGFAYLQTSSRMLAGLFIVNTSFAWAYADSISPSNSWQYWVCAGFILLLNAPYEVYFIFPGNDEILDMGRKLRDLKKDHASENEQKRLSYLLEQWKFRNLGRSGLSLVAGLIGLATTVYSPYCSHSS